MKLKFYASRLLIVLLCLIYTTGNAQNCIHTAQYPSGTVAIAQSGTTNVTTCNWGGEYSINSFTTAGSYTIFGTGGSGNYFTVTDNANNVLISGASPLAVAIPSVGIYRIHVSTNSSCGTDAVCHDVNVVRVLPPCIHTSQYPSSTVSIAVQGTTNVTPCNWAGEYSVNSFSATGGYTINATGGAGNFITVTDNSNNVLATGNSPLAINIPSVGIYRIHLSTNTSCGSDAVCHIVDVNGTPPPSVVNDFCSAAIMLSVPGGTTGTTIGATIESPNPGTCGTSLSQPGVWYRVVGNGNQFGADLCATSGWDSKVFVYTGNCGAWSCVTGNDDVGPMCSSAAASVTWCSVPTTTYYILVTGYSSANAFSLTVTQTVNVSSPTVTAIALTPSVCLGSAVTLSASGASTYSWNTGATTASISLTPTASTVYTVLGRGSVGCGYDIKTVTITSIGTPTISLSANAASICPGGSFAITASGANTYTFNGLPSGTIIATTATLSPIVSTNYTVVGTGTNGCRSTIPNSGTATITTLVSPNLTVTSTPTAVCPGQTASLTVTGANTYTWSTLATGSIITVSQPVTTGYTVTGTGTTVCNGVRTASLIVYPSPTVSVNSGTICAGKVFTMVPTGASTYTYSNGSNTASPVADDSFSVTGTSAVGCISSNTAVASVSVFALPVVTASSGTICAGSSYSIVTSGALSYTVVGSSNPVSPTVTTSYSVVGSNSLGCVSLPAVSDVTVYALPSLSIVATPAASICNTSSVNLSVSGAITYTWNNTTPGSSIVRTPSVTTNYFAIGTDANGCENVSVVQITVNPLPNVGVTGNVAFICVGGTATLSAFGSGNYTWSPGGSLGTPLPVNPVVSTVYSVTSSNAFGCTRTATVSVAVNTIVMTISSNTSVCEGYSVSLSVGGLSSQLWSNGSSFSQITVSPSVTTTYTVGGVDSKNCSHSGSVNVTVNTNPVITSGVSPDTICAGEEATLTASGASSYSWGTVGAGSTVTISPLTSGNMMYVVTGTGSNGCSGYDTTSLIVQNCVGLNELAKGILGISVYPNPHLGEFTVELSGRSKTIEVSDITGRIILTEQSISDKTLVDLKSFAHGVYYVKITSGKDSEVVKVIKQ